MKAFTLACSVFLAAAQLEGLLPPLYQSAAEIREMVSSPELGEKLESGHPIERIELIHQAHPRTYAILTSQQVLNVEVHYLPSKSIGPAQFELDFGHPISYSH